MLVRIFYTMTKEIQVGIIAKLFPHELDSNNQKGEPEEPWNGSKV